MEVTYLTKAVVLNNQPWSEYDSKVVFYTQSQGRLELVARGTQKPSSKLIGHLQPYNLVSLMVINGRTYPYAGAVDSLNCFLKIKQDWSKLKITNYVFTVWQKLIISQESDERLFMLLVKFLSVLNQVKSQDLYYQFLAETMLLKVLCYLGYQPDIESQQGKLGFLNQTDYYWQSLSKDNLLVLERVVGQEWPESIKLIKLNKRLIIEVNSTIRNLVVLVLEK